MGMAGLSPLWEGIVHTVSCMSVVTGEEAQTSHPGSWESCCAVSQTQDSQLEPRQGRVTGLDLSAEAELTPNKRHGN